VNVFIGQVDVGAAELAGRSRAVAHVDDDDDDDGGDGDDDGACDDGGERTASRRASIEPRERARWTRGATRDERAVGTSGRSDGDGDDATRARARGGVEDAGWRRWTRASERASEVSSAGDGRARESETRGGSREEASNLNSPRSGGLNPRVRTVAFAWECALDEGMGR